MALMVLLILSAHRTHPTEYDSVLEYARRKWGQDGG